MLPIHDFESTHNAAVYISLHETANAPNTPSLRVLVRWLRNKLCNVLNLVSFRSPDEELLIVNCLCLQRVQRREGNFQCGELGALIPERTENHK